MSAADGVRAAYRLPEATTLQDAQLEVNFVTLSPTWLPPGCAAETPTLRPEQPLGRPEGRSASDLGHSPRSIGNPCSVRLGVSGPGRSLRIKQTLYDFAPPSASIAPLWGSQDVRRYVRGDVIVWVGSDYRGRTGACTQTWRTQVELAVTAGAFSDEELADVVAGLAPVDVDHAQALLDVPFHDLNYWVRHRSKTMGVPYGLLQYDRSRRYQHATALTESELESGAVVPVMVPVSPELVFDSAVQISDDATGHHEVEVIYRHRANRSDHVWISAIDARSPLAYELPPRREPQLAGAIHGPRSLTGLGEVWTAAVDDEVGAFEARWRHGPSVQSVWCSPSTHLDLDGFLALLTGARRAPRRMEVR